MNLVTLWRQSLTGFRSPGSAERAGAQNGVERSDRRQGRRDTRSNHVDRAQWFTDRMDVRRLKRLVLMLDRAHGARDWLQEPSLRNRIHEVLRQELYELEEDLERDGAEELWRRDDLQRDYLEGREPSRREEHRDPRNDAKENAESRRRLMREVEILNRLRQIQPAVERGGKLARFEEDRMLGSFLKLAREDARADQRDRRREVVRNGDDVALNPTAR